MTAPAISPAEKLAGAAQELLDLVALDPRRANVHAPEWKHLRAALDALPGREVLAAREAVVDVVASAECVECEVPAIDAAVAALLAAERAESTSYAVERQDRLRAAELLAGKAGA